MSRAWHNYSTTTPKKPPQNWKSSAPCAMKPCRRNKRHYSRLVLACVSLCCLITGCRPGNATGKTAAPPPPPPQSFARFTDISKSAGINYQWRIEGKRPLNILQTIGNGCAFLDYDNDGNLDILLIGPKLALYKGDGKGHFTDVTRATGLDKFSGHFLGCAVGDYDNDGYPDVYISGYRTGLLLHNEAGAEKEKRRKEEKETESAIGNRQSAISSTRIFKDVTRQAGLKPQAWGTACAWAETVPGSGRLDLFVANYARFGTEPGIDQLCELRGLQTSCGPAHYKPLLGTFYRNLGAGPLSRGESGAQPRVHARARIGRGLRSPGDFHAPHAGNRQR